MLTSTRICTCLAVVVAVTCASASTASAQEVVPITPAPAAAPAPQGATTPIDPATGLPVAGVNAAPTAVPAPAAAQQTAVTTVDESGFAYRVGQFVGILVLVVLALAVVQRIRR